MSLLLDQWAEERRIDLFETAVAVNLAMNDPKKIVRLLDDPSQRVEATGMIAIPKKKRNG